MRGPDLIFIPRFMLKFKWKCAIALLTLSLFVAGCDSNPTNEPSEAAIKEANVKRAAAIDNDPKLTPEQKAKMKQVLHLDGNSGPAPRN